MKRAIITGGAGFIGSHLTELLLNEGNWEVTIIDCFDTFYAESIKLSNMASFANDSRVTLIRKDICETEELLAQLSGKTYDVIIHIAAKAGVRPSIQNPMEYERVNVKGTQSMLEIAHKLKIKQFVFASSSSVYGINPNVPWSESDYVLKPISPYAATKVAGELLGHVYAHLHGIRFVALRFFTVFGPRQRPDLAINKFAKALLHNEPITMYGDGSTRRDYTYVGDIVSGIRSAIDYRDSMYEIMNLGNHRSISLVELIQTMEEVFATKATIDRQPEQQGDVPQTFANIEKAQQLLGYIPHTDIKTGIRKYKEWLQQSM
ncbi:MAG: GDP-mannose 4,6-dehydratase [Bacteroidota bacterium]